MYKALKDTKIIAINDTGDFPCLVYDEVVEDTEHVLSDYVQCDGEFVLTTDAKAVALKQAEVRQVRSDYFDKYVDFYQSKPLMWEEMEETEKQHIAEYRIYLKDYTSQENWWENNPATYEEWLVAHYPVTEGE